jgi:Zn-dependent peptidase ImmA (M78 family)/transcriptional regulator with XRE-family HTH domain
VTTTADRVRGLIDAGGESQRDFAAAVGLDATKLSKSLSGVRRFSSLDLARIAEHAHVSVDWLLTGDVPLAVAGRSAGGGAATAIAKARELMQLRADLAFLGYPQQRARTAAIENGGSWQQQGSRAAALALEQVGVELIEADSLASAIERGLGIDVAIADLGSNFDGLAVSSSESAIILVAQSALPARQRFTIAHELGHLLAGDDQELHVDEDVYSPALRRDASEVRANAFASAFLMPEAVLRAATPAAGFTEETFALLACDLQVSPSALAYRLSALRLIDSGKQDGFKRLSSEAAARVAGRGEDFARAVSTSRSQRPPGLLLRDAWAAYESGATTLRAYANVVGVDMETLRDALASEVDERPAP